LTAGLFAALTLAKGSIPLLDALITALSLTAQWLLNQRKLESWIFWISVDLVSIPVYAYKQLYLIALLYGVFLGLAILGYRQWRQAVADDRCQLPS
jgi:nicotinamide mononucleotide transporter